MFTNDAINWPSRVTIDDESFPEDTLGREVRTVLNPIFNCSRLRHVHR
jgi:hypothetical protein